MWSSLRLYFNTLNVCKERILIAMISATITNSKAESGQPCLIPREIVNGTDNQPLFDIIDVHCYREVLSIL